MSLWQPESTSFGAVHKSRLSFLVKGAALTSLALFSPRSLVAENTDVYRSGT